MDITGLGSAFDFARGIMDRFWPKQASEQEKMAAIAGLIPILEARETAVVEAQKAVMVAEMSQGDTYTKRARPTIVYAGLIFIFMVHVAFPIITYISGQALPDLKLPEEFWWSYTGVCGVWILGRSMEKNGTHNKIVNMITGGK